MFDFRVDGVRQTPWACGHNGAIWYACVHADVHDEAVINAAKRIVDKAIPQKLSTFFWWALLLIRDEGVPAEPAAVSLCRA